MDKRNSSTGGRKLRAAAFSIAANAILITMKLAVALLTGSIAIFAELAHSFFDMLASLLAYAGIRKAEEPPDDMHHYGHEKFENFSSFSQTILIVITSVIIIYQAVYRILYPAKPELLEIGLLVMAATIAIDLLVSRYLHRSSKDYQSSALEADAYHFTTDLWGAIAVVIGLAFVLLGFQIFDSIAAIVVALLMLWISYKLGKKSFHVLMDQGPSQPVMDRIAASVQSNREVKLFHKLKVRQAGSKLHVEMHIHVSPKMSVGKGHRVGHNVKKRLMREMPEIKDVTVHVEPHIRRRKK